MPSALDSMSIIAWLLAIMARESSDGIRPTVNTVLARAAGVSPSMGAAISAGAPASKVRRVKFIGVSRLPTMTSVGLLAPGHDSAALGATLAAGAAFAQYNFLAIPID